MGEIIIILLNSFTLLGIVVTNRNSIFKPTGESNGKVKLDVDMSGIIASVFIWVLMMGGLWVAFYF